MANLAQIIPALFVGPGGQQLTQEQIRERQQMAQDLLAQATDTSPNAGGVASILAKGLSGFRAGMDRNAADRAISANTQENQGLLQGLLGGLGSTGGVGQSDTVAAPTIAPMQNVAPASIPQTADAAMIRRGLVDRGLPSHVADAFVVNFKDESGLNPGINEANPIVPGSRGGFGLYQLTGPRRTAYESFAAQRGVDPSDVNAQLDFLKYELDGPEAKAAQSILSAPDTATAAQAIVNNFLRPSEEHRTRRAASYANLGSQPAAPSDNGIESALASSTRSAFPSAPSAQSASSVVNPAIIAALSSPVANEQTRSVATALLNNQMAQQQAAQERALAQQQQQQEIAQRQAIAQSMGINPGVALDGTAWKAAVEAANRGRQTATVNGNVIDVNSGQTIFQAPQQPTTSMQDYNFYADSERQAGRQPLGPLEYEQAIRSAGAARTNIDTGTVPQGYQAIRDEQGRLIRYDPVPGGPADTTKTQAKAEANTQRSSNIVLEDVDRAVSAIESNPSLTTGIIGNWSRGIGGTPANKVQNLLQTVRANSAFDRLQQMREASPTGGALGAVSDSELGLLQNAIGSLEQSNNSEDLVYNLRRVQRIYEDIINGPDAAKKMREDRAKAGESASQPAQGWKDLGNGVKIRPKGSN